jgi:hypothetical protein
VVVAGRHFPIEMKLRLPIEVMQAPWAFSSCDTLSVRADHNACLNSPEHHACSA